MSYILADAKATTHEFLEGPYARVPKELGCAFAASFLVSPLVSIIDKAIVQEITCVRSLTSSMLGAAKEMVFQPRAFLGGLSFRLTFAVYFGTYATANLSEAALDYFSVKDEGTRKFYKVGAASIANVSLLAWRDSIFARVFSGGTPPAKTPPRTVGLFAVRDTVTMAATFWAAPKVCEWLTEEQGWDHHKAEVTSSFAIPVFAQFVTAPIHIHALDYYSNPTATTAERIATIKKEMGKVCFARGLRILPAFGIGSYSNNKFREWFIRQPNEELLLSRQITRRVTQFGNAMGEEKVKMKRRITTLGDTIRGGSTKPADDDAKKQDDSSKKS
eukprot:CAMPEP_0202480290 /NCGR_PEP_ID=MMETSP1361-20130828/341_1 /ASSEMBLY_ACC=CAM_ASM_000849 /TAXON_ID=210615 /ORGANISM="Staurosira complex sp., Strain CCMP2646" /LENGTH=330 /DNA_ID=CAMNT_0049107711 /DNA_START=92 /DNA_END=1084 /DNA_ORIENTATION=-